MKRLPLKKSARAVFACIAVAALVLAALVPFQTPVAYASTLDLQPDATAGQDDILISNFTTHNYGTSTFLDVGDFGPGSHRRGLIKFDLSSIPAGATINSATLNLYMTNNLASNTRTLRVYAMVTSWTEGSGDDTATADGGTWATTNGSASWPGAAGGQGSGNSETSDMGSLSISSGAGTGVQAISLSTSKIQSMITGGGLTNNGFMLMNDTEVSDLHRFASSDDSTAGHRPELVIDYSVPTPTSVPSSTPTANPLGLVDGIQAYWNFNTDFTDATGNGNTLNASGGAHINCSVFQLGGCSAAWDGPFSDNANSASNSHLQSGAGSFAIAGWLNPQGAWAASDPIIISKWDEASDNEYLLYYDHVLDRMKFSVSSDGSSGSATIVTADHAGGLIGAGPQFFVAWYDAGEHTLNIQIGNGTPDSVSYSSGIFQGGADFVMGTDGTYVGHYYNGFMDEVGIWHRALSPDERAELYNAGAGCAYPFTSCDSFSATPQASPTPGNSSDYPNVLLNGSFEKPQAQAPFFLVGPADNWDRHGPGTTTGVNQNATAFVVNGGGPAECGAQYLNVNGGGASQRVFLPAPAPIYLSFWARRKLDDGGRSFAQLEIDSTATGGVAGVDWTVLNGKNGEYIGRSTTNNGWSHYTVSHPFLIPNGTYFDVRMSSIQYVPGGWAVDSFGHSYWQPPLTLPDTNPIQDWQIDNIVITTSGYGSYCAGPNNATVTPNPTTTATSTPTTAATSAGTAFPTLTPSYTPTGAPSVFQNCNIELGSTAWSGEGFSVQLAGGPVGPQFLRIRGITSYAQQPFDWGGGAAYFTFWVGPGSGGSVTVVNVQGGTTPLWDFSESSPSWKQVRVTVPNLASGHYQLRINGSSTNDMDVDGLLPSANGYAYCGSGTTQTTPTSGPTSFVTPTPTITPPSTLTLLPPTSTPHAAPGSTSTQNATWTATVTAAPATGTPTASNTPTPGNGSTATSVAGTSTAAASITPATRTATATGTPPTSTPSAMPNPTQQPEPAPNADCNRPDNPLNLAWWVDYEVCRVLTWFVWSPDNTNQMINMQATLQVYEPLGTLNELENARNVAQAQLAAYDWANTGLQGTTGLPSISILFPSTVPSGLLTGNLQLGPGAPNAYPFITACTLKTGAIFGDAMGKGLCATVNWLVETGIMGWVQFLFDVAVWVAFMRYGWYVVVTKLPQIM